MLAGAGTGQCLVCLTLNIAGDVKRTPMTRMLFDH
jgi:phosphoribosyl-dephospho-CoA transferase